jgi:NADH dehydrogenase FAD-containing subunit
MTEVVAIVGGGYGGSLVAEALDGLADVVLIDPRDAFLNVAASLRALTQPEFAPSAFFPFESLLGRGRVVRDHAVSVDATGIALASGARVEADYIVLATGSHYGHPAHPRDPGADADAAIRDLGATHRQLRDAHRVIIVGAGPVGLELAGEIREVWPDKRITVLARGDDILPGYLPEVRESLKRELVDLDIELRLGATLTTLPAVPEAVLGSFEVETHSGERIEGDIWFRSFGSRVTTDYLTDGALVALTPSGLVPVTDRLTVVGHDNVYALGDIADLTDPKMATWAQTQAAVVVENLTAQLAGRPADAVYNPTSTQRIFLPLGSHRGVGQLPTPDGGVASAPLDVVIDRKGRDLFTARFSERFHVSHR